MSILSFLYYGAICLFTQKMVKEFNRFRLTDFQRQLTGILQLLGATGLLIGVFFSPWLAGIASGGLSILMALGFIVRLKIRDSLLLSIPSFFFMLVNAFLSTSYIQLALLI
nr:DoxX family protein [Fulvivirga aurantia]